LKKKISTGVGGKMGTGDLNVGGSIFFPRKKRKGGSKNADAAENGVKR